jgi:hypothetical protein
LIVVPAGTSPNVMQSSINGLRSQTTSISQALASQLSGTNFANANLSVASLSEPVYTSAPSPGGSCVELSSSYLESLQTWSKAEGFTFELIRPLPGQCT